MKPDKKKPNACPVCMSECDKLSYLYDIDGFHLWFCTHCSLSFVWSIPKETEMKSLYDDPAWFKSGLKGGYEDYDRQTQATLPFVKNLLETNGENKKNKSVLDIGCGYGTHLELANKLGWKCFGVEVSDHARKVAIQRHGDRVYFSESIDELIPHKFDLILLLDVIEHFSDPYRPFYDLFAKGSIGEDTTVVVTTPNAQSKEAIFEGNKWAYLHPPSHLFYYSAESLYQFFS